ncbi:MAG TPA: hypothetical protein VG984_00280 [Candidatus Paceibacterota bacterium]|nr:hypothetical protein [Candidatus Paceibacterota bacterium]
MSVLLSRRSFLTGGLALLAEPAVGKDNFFHWYRPGFEPYDKNGVRLEDALRQFRDLMAPDPDVADEFRRKVKLRQYTEAQIFPGWRGTRMLFGAHGVAPNVIVDASDFAKWGNATKKMRMYTARRVTGSEARYYALFFPEVCGNWCMRLGHMECVWDQKLCDQGCQDLKQRQRLFR